MPRPPQVAPLRRTMTSDLEVFALIPDVSHLGVLKVMARSELALSSSPPLISLLLVPPGDDASQDGGPSQSRDPEAMVQARVDIRKLQQFLMGQQVNPSKSMCSKSSWSSSLEVLCRVPRFKLE